MATVVPGNDTESDVDMQDACLVPHSVIRQYASKKRTGDILDSGSKPRRVKKKSVVFSPSVTDVPDPPPLSPPADLSSESQLSTVLASDFFVPTDTGPFKTLLTIRGGSPDSAQLRHNDFKVGHSLFRLGVKYNRTENIGRNKWCVFFDTCSLVVRP